MRDCRALLLYSDRNLVILPVFSTVQVRDIYDYGDYLILVTTDRQSAFDRVLASIPFKGQVGRFFTDTENSLLIMRQITVGIGNWLYIVRMGIDLFLVF